jgi:hypothetical protein
MIVVRQEQIATLQLALGSSVAPCRLAWIEVEVVDLEDNPVFGVRYLIRLPDGSTVTGATDSKGLARYDRIPSGQCEICLPDFDRDAWVQL